MKPRVHRLFIYGTLKRNFYFHDRYLGGDKSNFLGKATTGLDVSLYMDGMPSLVRESADKPVKGELYEVDEDVLKSLDELEGHPVVFKREIIDVVDESGVARLAWAYIRPRNFLGKKYSWKVEEFE